MSRFIFQTSLRKSGAVQDAAARRHFFIPMPIIPLPVPPARLPAKERQRNVRQGNGEAGFLMGKNVALELEVENIFQNRP